jgi:hypothetical protein
MATRSSPGRWRRGATGTTIAKRLFAGRGKNTERREKSWKTESGVGFGNDMQTVDSLNARQWFRWREPLAWAISIVVFTFLFFVLSQVFGGFFGFIIAGGAAFCLFFFYLDKRAFGIVCPHCHQYIETNTPWICGNKDTPHRNDQVDDFPFIYRCQHCGFIPKAYQCHHCFKLIFLSEDKQQTAFAKCADIPVKVPKPKPGKRDPYEDEIAKKKRVVELSELDVKKAKIDVELKGYKETLEPPKMKTVGERLRSRVHSKSELDAEVRRLKEEADKEFAGDEAGRAKRYLEIDAEARELL